MLGSLQVEELFLALVARWGRTAHGIARVAFQVWGALWMRVMLGLLLQWRALVNVSLENLQSLAWLAPVRSSRA